MNQGLYRCFDHTKFEIYFVLILQHAADLIYLRCLQILFQYLNVIPEHIYAEL